MEQTNLNDLFSIPDCVIKAPRSPFTNQGAGSGKTFQVVTPQDSNLEFVMKGNLQHRSPWPEAPSITQTNRLLTPHLTSLGEYVRVDPPEPEWLHRFQELPPIYRDILMATTRSYGLDTNTISRIFLSSGLDPRILQHIWSLVNRSHPGWLTPSELVLALALIAVAQRDQACLQQPTESVISSLSIQQVYQCPVPPVPNVVLPCHNVALPCDNFGQHFGTTSTNVAPSALSDSSRSVVNGLCNFDCYSFTDMLSTKSSTASQAADEDWADFTSCKQPNFGTPSWCPPLTTGASPVDTVSPSNRPFDSIVRRGESHTVSQEDEFGEFQAGVGCKITLMPSSRMLQVTPAIKATELQSEVGALPNYNLSADFESYQSPRDVLQTEWIRCLKQCSDVFCESLEALTSLTSAADIVEFVNVAEAHDFFLDLLEVYRMVRRIESSATDYGLLTPEIRSLFVTLKSSFHKHLDYLVSSDLQGIWESANSSPVLSSTPSPDTSTFASCSVCLVAFEREEALSPDPVIALAGRQYHLPCANFWTNRVQLSLPALVPP